MAPSQLSVQKRRADKWRQRNSAQQDQPSAEQAWQLPATLPGHELITAVRDCVHLAGCGPPRLEHRPAAVCALRGGPWQHSYKIVPTLCKRWLQPGLRPLVSSRRHVALTSALVDQLPSLPSRSAMHALRPA